MFRSLMGGGGGAARRGSISTGPGGRKSSMGDSGNRRKGSTKSSNRNKKRRQSQSSGDDEEEEDDQETEEGSVSLLLFVGPALGWVTEHILTLRYYYLYFDILCSFTESNVCFNIKFKWTTTLAESNYDQWNKSMLPVLCEDFIILLWLRPKSKPVPFDQILNLQYLPTP